MPYREYLCDYCGHQFEELVWSKNPEDYATAKCRCDSMARVLPAMIGGINGVSLSGARPKNSTAMPSKKTFAKPEPHPGNQGEPETDNK